MDRKELEELREQYRKALLDDVVLFWERHSVDREFGGFVTHLDRSGDWYGDQKAVWLQGRESWLFLTLYHELDDAALLGGSTDASAAEARRREWLELGRRGCHFLADHCLDQQGKMYFEVTRDGQPLRMRRHFYSEVFGVLAFGALARIHGDDDAAWALERARELFDSFVGYLRGTKHHPAIVPKSFEQTPTKALSPLMCLLKMCDTMVEIDTGRRTVYENLIDACMAEIESDFIRHDLRCVLESVPVERLNDDKLQFAQPQHRTMNPGHAIECAWFMLHVVYRRRQHQQQQQQHDAVEHERLEHVIQQALLIIDYCFERGWDDDIKYGGGFLYFIDILGRPPIQLEWDQKLWWPHNEALIALVLAYHMTHDAKYAQLFRRVHAYTWSHFPDPEHGEWFGYLHRDGSILTPLKGGTWKGAFHVPRCLLKCYQFLAAELHQQQQHQQQQ